MGGDRIQSHLHSAPERYLLCTGDVRYPQEDSVSAQQRQSVPNQSRISLPWDGGRKRKEFIRCIQSGLPIIPR